PRQHPSRRRAGRPEQAPAAHSQGRLPQARRRQHRTWCARHHRVQGEQEGVGGAEECRLGAASAAGKRFLSSVLPSGSKIGGGVGACRNDARAAAGFVLFDSALVPSERIESIINDGYPGRCLYGDLGEEAKRVSPWLLPLSPPAEELGREMRESGTHAYGVSFLLTPVPIDVLSLHLQRLRKVFAGQKRYYLRYADGRAFSDLWRVLDQGQRTAMLGPVEAWKAHPSREPFQRGTKSDTELFSHEDGLPLRLSTQQFSA